MDTQYFPVECGPKAEREPGEQPQNTEDVNMEGSRRLSSDKPRKRQKQSYEEVLDCDYCEFTGSSYQNLAWHTRSKHNANRYTCDQCEYVGTQLSYLKQHKESRHKGVRYSCDQCEYAAFYPSHLKRHKATIHEGVRHPCDQCEYFATQLSHLKYHKRTKHEIKGYPCVQCGNVATEPLSLKQREQEKYECNECTYVSAHVSDVKQIFNREKIIKCAPKRKSYKKKSKHRKTKQENIARRYPCDQCEYAATHSSHLKRHKESIHDGVRYPCDQCEHVTTQVSHLKRHKKDKHKYKPKTTESEFVETYDISEIVAEVKEEAVEDPLSLVKIDPIEFPEYDPRLIDLPLDVKQETDMCDLESKIEIEEHFVTKTEFSD